MRADKYCDKSDAKALETAGKVALSYIRKAEGRVELGRDAATARVLRFFLGPYGDDRSTRRWLGQMLRAMYRGLNSATIECEYIDTQYKYRLNILYWRAWAVATPQHIKVYVRTYPRRGAHGDFRSLTPPNKALLLVHEASHAYVRTEAYNTYISWACNNNLKDNNIPRRYAGLLHADTIMCIVSKLQ